MAHDEQLWLTQDFAKAAACVDARRQQILHRCGWASVGTCDVVSMVVDGNASGGGYCLDWADVVRDGIVWGFLRRPSLYRAPPSRYTLEQQLGCCRFTTRRPRSRRAPRPAYFDQRAGVCRV